MNRFLALALALALSVAPALAGSFFSGSNIATPVTVPNGGTGQTGGTSGGIPYYDTASTLNTTAVLSSTGIVLGSGAGSAPITSPNCTINSVGSQTCSSTSAFNPTYTLINTTADANAAYFVYQKQRSGSAVVSGDALANLLFDGFSNSSYQQAASLSVTVDAAPSTNNVPSNITFKTSNASGQLNQAFKFDRNGHFSATLSGLPQITACGTSPSAARGSDNGGEVTEGTTATGCVISFATAYTAAPFCTVTTQSQLVSFAYTISTSAITIVNTSASGTKVNWICQGS